MMSDKEGAPDPLARPLQHDLTARAGRRLVRVDGDRDQLRVFATCTDWRERGEIDRLLGDIARAVAASLQEDDRVPHHRLRHPGAAGESAQERATYLTPREMDILWGIAKGLSYSDIAAHLNLSVQTVPGLIKSLYRKLGVNSRSEAVYEAVQQGLITLTERHQRE